MEDFAEWVAASGPAHKRLAYLLVGDLDQAEDLLQSAYARVFPKWRGVRDYENPDAYLRRVMVNLRTSWWRRHRGRELSVAEVRDVATADASESVVAGEALLQALAGLTERQRAAVVLRHYLDLSEAETAATMNCSIGTVKSTTSKALAHLRSALDISEVN